ncbi:MAG: acyl-CoA dehydrogenase family protein [Mycobacteriales bacterium]
MGRARTAGGLTLPALAKADPSATHEVRNVVPPLEDYDVSMDAALREGLAREGGSWYAGRLSALGVRAGQGETLALGDEANRDLPRLHTHDRVGHRRDEVVFCSAWHELLRSAVGEGLSGALTWHTDGSSRQPGSHVARAAGFYVWSQVEGGHLCPVSMSYAAVPVLRGAPEVAAALIPALVSGVYAPELAPLQEKPGLLLGMGMTEKQGGSDVRANSTVATPVSGGYLLRGHKWFTSAPMSDGFLMLAQAPGGLSCFFVPRVLPDGTRNRLHLARLKDKCGNRSNASSEVELADAAGVLVGEEGRGVRTIIDMVALTRLDCVAGSAALQRVALSQAIWHARHRRAFGQQLFDAALMQAVLADLALESEAATALTMRLAGAVDRAARGDEQEAAFARIGTAVCKYWVCKRTPSAVAEALECLGGNGYVEDSRMPRYYREAPLNSIWEGAGNVNALDVLRAAARHPKTLTALRAELALAAGRSAWYDSRLHQFEDRLASADERSARSLAERAALLLAAGLLLRHAPEPVADAFVRARLSDEAGVAFGALPAGVDLPAILARAGLGLPG